MSARWMAEARTAYANGDYASARQLFERALANCVEQLGPEHPDALQAMSDVAVAHYQLGELGEARRMQSDLLRLRERISGPEDPATLQARSNLAWTLYALGELEPARALFEDVASFREGRSGPDHPETLTAWANLAWILQVSGNLADARSLQERILAVRLRERGEEHPDTVAAMATLAATLYALGALDDARRLQEQAVSWHLRASDAEHPATLVAKGNLALTIYAQGDLLTARSLQEEVLAVRHRRSGDQHPETLAAMTNLAVTLQAQGDLDAARQLQSNVLALRRESRGQEHPETLVAMADLALTLHGQGELTSAEELERTAFTLRSRVLGRENPHTLATMQNLALTLFRQGRLEEARKLNEDVLEIRRRVSGERHAETITALGNLAVMLAAENDLASARVHHERALALRAEVLGDLHPHTITSRGELAGTLDAMGEVELSYALIEQVVAQRRQVLGDQHPDTLAALVSLAVALWKTQRFRQCAAALGEVFDRLTERSTPMFTVNALTALDAVRLVDKLLDVPWPLPWRAQVAALSARWLEAFHLAPPARVDGLWNHFVEVHLLWLSLCMRLSPSDVPLALAALQGREMAAALHEELATRDHDVSASDALKRYLAELARLRALRLQLTVLAGDARGRNGLHGDGLVRGTKTLALTEQQQSFEKRLLREYEAAHAAFLLVEKELSRSEPELALLFRRQALSAAELSASLGPGEVLVLLFALPRGDGPSVHACCIHDEGAPNLIELTNLPSLIGACERYEAALRSGPRGRTLRGALRQAEHPDSVPTLSAIAEALERDLWQPLSAAYPHARRWHVATHQQLQNVPVGMGSEKREDEVYVYPGVAFFGRKSRPSAPATRILLHVDAAWKKAPIPMVEAEAALVADLLPDVIISRGSDTLTNLQQTANEPYAFAAAAHGDVHQHEMSQAQAAILLDADAAIYLDGTRWLATGTRPHLAVLSACVGARLIEPFGGEPFGLVSAMLMRGCETVIGSLAAVPDFYMPILIGLFWESYRSILDGRGALDCAKRSLRTGAWPSGFEARMRGAYSPVMERVLEQIHADFDLGMSLMPTLAGWSLPPDVRQRHFVRGGASAQLEFAHTHCATELNRRELVRATLDILVGSGQLPDDVVEHLCAWVHSFGGAPSGHDWLH